VNIKCGVHSRVGVYELIPSILLFFVLSTSIGIRINNFVETVLIAAMCDVEETYVWNDGIERMSEKM